MGLGIHENEHTVVFIEELLVFLLQTHALDLVGGTEALVEFRAVAQVAHLDLREGTALAGLDVIDLHSGPKTVIMFEDIPGANFVSVDFGHCDETMATG